MSDTEIVLFAGTSATDDPDDTWLPSLSLDHDAGRRELYVIVGEEAAGMAEGVPAEVYEAIRARLAPAGYDREATEGLTEGQLAVLAMVVAMSKTRDGMWVKGAPTHVFPEFLRELEALGWKLVRT